MGRLEMVDSKRDKYADPDADQWQACQFDGGGRGPPGGGARGDGGESRPWHRRFAADGDMVGVDLDQCLDAAGMLKPWALPIIEKFAFTYMEVSPSGAGIKIFARGNLTGLVDGSGIRKGYHDGAVEVYHHSRFFTVTGRAFNGAPLQVEQNQQEIEWLVKLVGVHGARPVARPESPKLNGDDATALQQVLEAARANDAKFAMLWNGNLCGFPSHSEADLSFCSFLAQTLGFDAPRIDRSHR